MAIQSISNKTEIPSQYINRNVIKTLRAVGLQEVRSAKTILASQRKGI